MSGRGRLDFSDAAKDLRSLMEKPHYKIELTQTLSWWYGTATYSTLQTSWLTGSSRHL